MRILCRAALVVLAAATAWWASPASAQQNPGSFATLSGPYGGPIRLTAFFLARDNCQAALSAHQSAPAGQSVGSFVAPVTIVIGPNPRGCGNSRLVQRIVTVTGAGFFRLIQIFFVDPSGRVLRTERVSIPTS